MALNTNDLIALVSNTITTNGNEEVSAADVRSVLEQVIDSYINILDVPARYISYQVVISSGDQLAGVLDSTKQYFLNGIIDVSSVPITVPDSGVSFAGLGASISKLVSTSASYTMFAGGGSINGKGFSIEASGASSKVYDLTAATGSEAVELLDVNYDNCTSLGEIEGYRQILETNSGRFGGSPSLTLSGSMDGVKVDVSIVRNMSDATTEPLFKAGASLSFSGRFSTNINCDLGSLQPLTDFAPSNFANASSLVFNNCLITRDGVIDADDTNINTGILNSDLESNWSDNVGIKNTFEGGKSKITTEAATVIAASDTFYDIAGTFSASDLQHFDVPANGQLRSLGVTPRSYGVTATVSIEGTGGDVATIKAVKWDNSASVFLDIDSETSEINNSIGALDKTSFVLISNIDLDVNDYVKLQIKNETAARNITANIGSKFLVEGR